MTVPLPLTTKLNNNNKKDDFHFAVFLRESFCKMFTKTQSRSKYIFSPSIKKDSVEGEEPMGWNTSSEWDLLLQLFPSLSDSTDVPNFLKLEGQESEEGG